MRISKRKIQQFRYAFGAGKSDAKAGLPEHLKGATGRWMTEAYWAGYDYGEAEQLNPMHRYMFLRLMRPLSRLPR